MWVAYFFLSLSQMELPMLSSPASSPAGSGCHPPKCFSSLLEPAPASLGAACFQCYPSTNNSFWLLQPRSGHNHFHLGFFHLSALRSSFSSFSFEKSLSVNNQLGIMFACKTPATTHHFYFAYVKQDPRITCPCWFMLYCLELHWKCMNCMSPAELCF